MSPESGFRADEPMGDSLRFETPENVTVSYELAGLGTRFVAWVFDMLIMLVAEIVFVLAMIPVVATFSRDGSLPESGGYLLGIIILVLGTCSTLYFLLFELFMSGQTPGKRSMRIRVVMAEGFSLTLGAVFLRNIFRLIDTVPLFWIVPFLSRQGQRFGDMVAGTAVVTEQPAGLQGVEMQLMQRNPSDATFRFTAAQLNCLDQTDFDAIATYLERKTADRSPRVAHLGARLARAVAGRMTFTSMPEPANQDRFLEDLLTAHLHRQVGQVG